MKNIVALLAFLLASVVRAGGWYDAGGDNGGAAVGGAVAGGSAGPLYYGGTNGRLAQDSDLVVSGGELINNRSEAFSGPVDSGLSVYWTMTPGAAGLGLGIYGELTTSYTGTEASGGHTIGVFGKNIATESGNEEFVIGVEGMSVSASTMTDHRSYGVIGRGIIATGDAEGVEGVAIGGRFSGEITQADAETARSTGTAIGIHLPGNKGGASGQTYGIKQDNASEVNQFSGIMNFQSYVIMGGANGGAVPCGAATARWMFAATDGSNELCYCDGSNWQGISSGTDANCS